MRHLPCINLVVLIFAVCAGPVQSTGTPHTSPLSSPSTTTSTTAYIHYSCEQTCEMFCDYSQGSCTFHLPHEAETCYCPLPFSTSPEPTTETPPSPPFPPTTTSTTILFDYSCEQACALFCDYSQGPCTFQLPSEAEPCYCPGPTTPTPTPTTVSPPSPTIPPTTTTYSAAPPGPPSCTPHDCKTKCLGFPSYTYTDGMCHYGTCRCITKFYVTDCNDCVEMCLAAAYSSGTCFDRECSCYFPVEL